MGWSCGGIRVGGAGLGLRNDRIGRGRIGAGRGIRIEVEGQKWG